MRENYEAVGFIPITTVAQRYIARGQYILQPNHRGSPVGYLLHGKPTAGGVLTVAQHVVDLDWRTRGYGRQAFIELLARARIANCRAIHLRCAEGLPSNEFWASMGFETTSVLTPANVRQRAINVMVLDLWPNLFTTNTIQNPPQGAVEAFYSG